MKLPRLRTRGLLILVGLAGLALGPVAWLERRAATFRAEASRNYEKWMILESPAGLASPLANHHLALAGKYHRAARMPWLPVEPDPPPPKDPP